MWENILCAVGVALIASAFAFLGQTQSEILAFIGIALIWAAAVGESHKATVERNRK